ncbi:hypothetical protein RYX36_017649 [Vicia faba]
MCVLKFFFSCISKEMKFPKTPSLPVAEFNDLVGDGDENGEEICSICLVELEGKDAVSKLKKY